MASASAAVRMTSCGGRSCQSPKDTSSSIAIATGVLRLQVGAHPTLVPCYYTRQSDPGKISTNSGVLTIGVERLPRRCGVGPSLHDRQFVLQLTVLLSLWTEASRELGIFDG